MTKRAAGSCMNRIKRNLLVLSYSANDQCKSLWEGSSFILTQGLSYLRNESLCHCTRGKTAATWVLLENKKIAERFEKLSVTKKDCDQMQK